MRRDFLEVERDEALSETARRMVERELGSAVVAPVKPKPPPDLVTDRDIPKPPTPVATRGPSGSPTTSPSG